MSKDNLIERQEARELLAVQYADKGGEEYLRQVSHVGVDSAVRAIADALIRKQALIEEQDKVIEDLGEQANRWRNKWGEAKALIEEMVEGLKKARSMLVSQMHAAGGFSLPESYYENDGVRLIDVLITKATNT